MKTCIWDFFGLSLAHAWVLSSQLQNCTGVSGGSTTTFVYDTSWRVLEERVSGVVQSRYVWSPVYADALVLRDRDTDANGSLDERLYAVQDANWNVVALVSTSGTAVERYAYDPYGQAVVLDGSYGSRSGSSYGWKHGFQGMMRDDVTGFSEADQRWYSASLGRWITTDPILYAGGDNNLYRFVGNRPVNRVDPSGLFDPANFPKPTTQTSVATTVSTAVSVGAQFAPPQAKLVITTATKSFNAGVAISEFFDIGGMVGDLKYGPQTGLLSPGLPQAQVQPKPAPSSPGVPQAQPYPKPATFPSPSGEIKIVSPPKGPPPPPPDCPKPGDCSEAEHRRLQDEVERLLEATRGLSCHPGMPPETAAANAVLFMQYALARNLINTKCFRGGNRGHVIAKDQAVTACTRCFNVAFYGGLNPGWPMRFW